MGVVCCVECTHPSLPPPSPLPFSPLPTFCPDVSANPHGIFSSVGYTYLLSNLLRDYIYARRYTAELMDDDGTVSPCSWGRLLTATMDECHIEPAERKWLTPEISNYVRTKIAVEEERMKATTSLRTEKQAKIRARRGKNSRFVPTVKEEAKQEKERANEDSEEEEKEKKEYNRKRSASSSSSYIVKKKAG